MTVSELILKNRSTRAFDESTPISKATMEELIRLAAKSPSGMNKQPVRYRVLSDAADIDKMLENCRFAGLLGIKLPPEGQKPTGFILMFTDKEAKSPETLALKDIGIAAEAILLGAAEKGFAGCMLGSFNPTRLLADFGISDRYIPQLAIALGKSAEEIRLIEAKDGNLNYYRDENGVHIVPKLPDADLFI